MLLILPLIYFLQAPQDIRAMDRDIQIQGFNGVKLGASIKMPENPSPWFAVLVQDAGLTDRNGRSPAAPRAQTGLAVAELLKSIGIGSLRYDKRLIGAKDPKLDTSLDAQLGDLSAAISAARSLPETKNKNILLVGHGEGALLSLLVSSQAEALLMLAPPSGSMAKTIRSHAEAQLPATIKSANLAYLDSVFRAIREGMPVPQATVGIHAAISQMSRSLMAPETLGFVKSTLDIDPWAVASRLSVPNAAVWGGKDIVTSKPPGIEGFYKGASIDLPNANHHFRQEPRPKDSLDGTSAASAYSDDAPLADLSAVAAWVKSLIL